MLLEARRVSGRALSAEGLRVSSDVAVPIARLADMSVAIEQISREEGVAIPTFAHAGDGDLHPSVIVDPADADARDHGERVLDRVSDAALALGGTLSGEHGIGSLKRHALPEQLDPATLAAHRLAKHAFDPHHILSPGRGISRRRRRAREHAYALHGCRRHEHCAGRLERSGHRRARRHGRRRGQPLFPPCRCVTHRSR